MFNVEKLNSLREISRLNIYLWINGCKTYQDYRLVILFRKRKPISGVINVVKNLVLIAVGKREIISSMGATLEVNIVRHCFLEQSERRNNERTRIY